MPFEVIVIVVIVVAQRGARLCAGGAGRGGGSGAAADGCADGRGGARRARAARPAAEIVPGDVLVLAEGDAVGADARLVEAASLTRRGGVADGRERGRAEGRRPVAGRRARRPARTWCSAAQRSLAARPSGRDGHRHGDRDGQRRPPARAHRGRVTPLQREVARIGRMLGIAVIVDRRRRRRARSSLTADIASAVRRRRRAARRRLAGGRRGARRPAGGAVGRARARRAADGAPAGDRQAAVVGGDARLGVGDLLGQDRDADARTR